MDAFLTPAQRALRQAARSMSRDKACPDIAKGLPESGVSSESLERLKAMIVSDSLPLGERDTGKGVPSFLETALILEEISAAAPKSGPPFAAADPSPAAVLGRLIGTAAFVLDACYHTAREKGLFASVLKEFQNAQRNLADALGTLEAVRLQGYRALLLLDGGEEEKAGAELARSLEQARAVVRDVSALAAGLCGDEWIKQNVPPENERRCP